MSSRHGIANDPRTIARDVAGILESIFPQLSPGIVSHFNRANAFSSSGCTAIAAELLSGISFGHAMLFELAVVVAERELRESSPVDWESCLRAAWSRQRRYFDAQIPTVLSDRDKYVAMSVAHNLKVMLEEISLRQAQSVQVAPRIPGYQWIASGAGDFCTQRSIIEIKCTGRRFSTADYRQIVIYWLLAYVEGMERDNSCWSTAILLNPRLNFGVEVDIGELTSAIAGRRSLVEIVERFRAIIEASALVEDFPWVEAKTGR